MKKSFSDCIIEAGVTLTPAIMEVIHYNIFNYSRLEPVENSEISTYCLQGSCSAAELNRHKIGRNNPNKKYIL